MVERRFLQSYRERETGAALLEQAFGIESSAHGSEGRAAGPGLAARAYLDAPTYRLFQRRWLTVELQIEPGLHVYGRPIPEGYIPLEIVVAPLEGLVVGAPQGPAPRPFRMTGLPEPFVVFEGRATFRLPLTFNKKPGESGGDTTLAVSIRYQACSEGDCLMPDSLTFELPIQAENLVDLDR